jgi:hypothetical protein
MTDKEEQKKHKRFRVREDVLVIPKPYGSKLGQLINIGVDGLTFEYLAIGEPSSHPTALDIVMPGSGFALYNIPCKTVWDHTTFESPLASMTMRQCSVRFEEPSPSQVAQLKYLIKSCEE